MDAADPSDAVSPRAKRLINDSTTHWIWLTAACGILVASFVFQVDAAGEGKITLGSQAMPGLCHMKRLTGIDCPGCGLTRSFVALAHARWEEAWRFNPAGPLWFVLVALQIPYRAYQLRCLRLGKEAWDPGAIGTAFYAIGIGSLLLQWVLRRLGVI